MELGLFLLELLLGVVDVLFAGFDIYSWIKGSGNRRDRRQARQAGLTPPARDKWNRRVITLSLVVVLVTGFLLVRLLR